MAIMKIFRQVSAKHLEVLANRGNIYNCRPVTML